MLWYASALVSVSVLSTSASEESSVALGSACTRAHDRAHDGAQDGAEVLVSPSTRRAVDAVLCLRFVDVSLERAKRFCVGKGPRERVRVCARK
eukprot:6199542-Pleurochrysis_carterae.AAC.1